MKVRIYADTDPGLVRSNNEDSVAFDVETGLGILADGMGGHNAGEVASGMATTFIKSEMRKWLLDAANGNNPADVETALKHCVTQANRAIYNMSRGSPKYAGMGTTLVVAIFRNDALVLAHIGDSRCYRLRDGRLEQITKDHSVQQEQLDSGLMLDQTVQPIYQNLVTRALGTDEAVVAEIQQLRVVTDDLYLLCSDGLSDMLSSDAIAAILAGADSIEEKTKRLMAAANQNGGRDNIAVVLAQVGKLSGNAGLAAAAGRAIRGLWS